MDAVNSTSVMHALTTHLLASPHYVSFFKNSPVVASSCEYIELIRENLKRCYIRFVLCGLHVVLEDFLGLAGTLFQTVSQNAGQYIPVDNLHETTQQEQ